MPWDVKRKGSQHCVYDKDGKELKCYPSRDAALAYQRALYANTDDVVKELIDDLLRLEGDAISKVIKQDDRYRIVAVSTAALEDRQGETFTAKAMDYDIQEAYKANDFPEFRVFHSPALGIGRVDKMRRVGIFAVDEGYSYTDPFSLDVCEKMLLDNPDGKWRTSRGFKAVEVGLDCPGCGSELVISKSHMVVGFRCPNCKSEHLSFKGKPNVSYLKARTFDVSVTDVPVVPMTSAAAFVEKDELLEDSMNKNQLKERLLKAGIAEEAVDERLKQVTDEQLKQFDDIPDATLLKELELEEEDSEQGYMSADELAESIRSIVKEELVAALDGFEIEIPSVELKEDPTILQLKEAVENLTELVDELLESQETLLKEWRPRGAKSRRLPTILKGKGKKVYAEADEEEEDDDEDEEEDEEEMMMKKEWFKHFQNTPAPDTAIQDGAGNSYGSLTEMIHGSSGD